MSYLNIRLPSVVKTTEMGQYGARPWAVTDNSEINVVRNTGQQRPDLLLR